MDIVIPYKETKSREIIYALRSVESYLSEVDNVFIIGDDPFFLQNVIHIPAKDIPGYKHKEFNCHSKLMLACRNSEIGETFLYMNDDHYLLQKYNAEIFPNYYFGSINKNTGVGLYASTVENTIRIGGEIKNFDIHCPMIIGKYQYREVVGSLNWTLPFGYCIKSVYGYGIGLWGQSMPDCKVKFEGEFPGSDRAWFSTSDKWIGWTGSKLFIESLFPNKSKYEL